MRPDDDPVAELERLAAAGDAQAEAALRDLERGREPWLCRYDDDGREVHSSRTISSAIKGRRVW